METVLKTHYFEVVDGNARLVGQFRTFEEAFAALPTLGLVWEVTSLKMLGETAIVETTYRNLIGQSDK